MADIELIKPRELPEQANVQATDALMVDNGTIVGKATPEKIVNAGAPVASEAEALAGVNNTKRMTPLRVRQVLDNVNNPAVLRAQAWAESSTPPDPLLPDSKSAKTWASIAEQGTVMVQWSMIAADGQTVLGNDITTGEPIRAFGGVAQISVNGFGPITPEEYSVDSDGVITLTAPLAEGDVVSGFTQPRLSNSEAQAVVQGVLQQTGADVAAAQDAAARAEVNAALVKPQFDSIMQVVADTAMTDTTVPMGGTISINGVVALVRVPSDGEFVTTGGLSFNIIGNAVRPEWFGYTTSGDMAPYVMMAQDWVRKKISSRDDVFGAPVIEFGMPYYKFNQSYSSPVWIKHRAMCGVKIDVSNLSSGSALSLDNSQETKPMAMRSAANDSPCFDGASGTFAFLGPGIDSNVVWLELSASTDTSGKDTRNAVIRNAYYEGFGTGYKLGATDTYLCAFDNVRGELTNVHIDATEEHVSNAGERFSWVNCTFGGGLSGEGKCIKANKRYLGMTFTSCSFDFNKINLLEIGPSCQDASFTFNGCHTEKSSDGGMVSGSPVANKNVFVGFYGLDATVGTDTADVPPNGRVDGFSSPRVPLFTGSYNADLSGLLMFAYDRPYYGINDGIFMCSDDVKLLTAPRLNYPQEFDGVYARRGFNQFVHKSLIRNYNWNMSGYASGDTTFTPKGWRDARLTNFPNNVSLSLNSSTGAYESSYSWSISASGGVGSLIIVSDEFPVMAGNTMRCLPMFNGLNSTGPVDVRWQPEYYAIGGDRLTPTSVTYSSGVVSLAFASPHGIESRSMVVVSGSNESQYNGRHIVTAASASTLTYSISTSLPPASPATGNISAIVPYRKVGEGSLKGQLISSIYGDEDYVNYTGGRNWWARMGRGDMETCPSGAAFARVRIQISGLSDGDSILFGGAGVEVV